MTAPQTQLKLKDIECHFTWDLDSKRSKLLRQKDKLEDIGTEETNSWLGPIYNLQGFIQYKLGSTEEAKRLFSRATEVLRQQRKADQGPWLVVNYGNLAWLHHHLGEEDQSQAYLSKVDALIEEHPSPLQEELHPEVLAEKAWYLMKFDKEKRLQAADYFQRAVRMQPDMLQWQTSRVVALFTAHKRSETELDDDIVEEMRKATQEDPDNLYLAAIVLQQRAKSGEAVTDEAEELTGKILVNPVSSYSGIKPLLRLFRQLDLYNKAIEVAEEALRNHPDERYLKRCAILTYKWKVIFSKEILATQGMIDRGISLYEDLVSLYPHSLFYWDIDLAIIHTKSSEGLLRADQMYQELLERDLEDEERQLLYNIYAKYLYFFRNESEKSIQYHMRAAEIRHQSSYRQTSIKTLKKIAERGGPSMCRQILKVLENLQDYQSDAPQTQLKLKALECHFTWDLDSKRSKLLRLKDKLEDIGTEETNSWLGPIYNLQGFIQYKLGSTEEAQRLLSSATEALRQQRKADQGPWLVVNYGNLAWLHHHLGEEDQSQAYLSKVDALIEEHPSPLQEELHPEVLAEKAWYLMKFDKEKRLQAADYFQRAVRMQPDMLQWQTSRVVALLTAHKHSETELDDGIMEEMRKATQEDPDNLYLAALVLQQRAKRGEAVADEAEELTGKILLNPVSNYSGIKPLLRLFKQLDLYDKAIKVAEEALRNHPDERYLKRCAALTYKWKINFSRESQPNQSMIDKAVSLYEEVISLYPHSSVFWETGLAIINTRSIEGLQRADQIYQELLERDLEDEERQKVYNLYAKYLYFHRNEEEKSIQYHMKAAEICHQSSYRQTSIKALKKIGERGGPSMCRQVLKFLEKLQDYQSDAPQTQLKLKALECHFTWDLDSKRSKLLRLKDKLEDIGTEETNSWLGPIYNLQGFIQYKLGSTEEAQRLLSSATEALRQQRKADQGPWLVVNYGNLAWLHHHLGEEDQSQAYLSKVDALIEEHPSPLQEELHPEVLAEKAWYLMKFDKEKRLQAADYFQRAVRMQPDMLQWQTSRVVALVTAHKHSETELDDGIMEEMRMATQEDPDNLYLAALDLQQRAKRREAVTDEAEELTGKILVNPVSSYSGIKPLLRLFRQLGLNDKAIEAAEEALRNHPDERYLKRCAALTYKWKVIFSRERRPNQRMIDRAISLYEEVISLYPHSSVLWETDLAIIHTKSSEGPLRADQIYQELLERDLEDEERQLLYNLYAKYLYFHRNEEEKSIQYHMKAAEIRHRSSYRHNSIKELRKISEQSRNRMCREVQEFLENLQLQVHMSS
ncbi:uncharacterized protein ACNS7B_004459 [Menidia menidia]